MSFLGHHANEGDGHEEAARAFGRFDDFEHMLPSDLGPCDPIDDYLDEVMADPDADICPLDLVDHVPPIDPEDAAWWARRSAEEGGGSW